MSIKVELNVTEFRQRCMMLLDELPADGIVITKYGRPIARLLPIRQSPVDLIGSYPGFLHSDDDDLFSTGIEWNATS